MLIETTIRTPQHNNGKPFEYVTQHGYISTESWIFTPMYRITGTVDMHKVWFYNEDEYLKYKVYDND